MDNVFVSNHPLIAHKLAILRDVNTEPQKFRELVREIAGLLCYEVTSDLLTEPVTYPDPAGNCARLWLSKKESASSPFYGPAWVWWKASGGSCLQLKSGILAFTATKKH